MNTSDLQRQYNAGTARLGDTAVLAIRDNTGTVWLSIADFLQRNAAWVLRTPAYWKIPECPSAVVMSEGEEVLFVGAIELAELLRKDLGPFTPLPSPGAARVGLS